MRRRTKAPSTGSAEPPSILAASAAGPSTAAGSKSRGLFGLVCLCVLGLAAFLGSGAPLAGAVEACPNEEFRTGPSASLPDCRAYEMVSPPDKNGGDVMPEPTRTRSSLDGNAVSFASLMAFGDVQGTGVVAEYVARRSGEAKTNGWATHGIMPQVEPTSLAAAVNGMQTSYEWAFADDLSTSVVRTFTNIAGDPNLENVTNLYFARGLLSTETLNFELLSACPACTVPVTRPFGGGNPQFIDATPDYEHVLLEARINLTSDAPAQSANCVLFGLGCQPRLYEWDHGSLRYVGILPVAEGGGPAPRAIAGVGPNSGRYTLRTLSNDGSRAVFTVPSTAGGATGPLYMRIDHASTIRLSASERTDCADDPSCGGDGVPDPEPDPGGTQPARYEIASAEGTKVFFTTIEQLTDDDDNNNFDLYRYDATLPPDHPSNLTRVSIDDAPADSGDVVAVMGASDDGERAYFIAGGQLVSGGPAVSLSGIYAWNAGTLTYVGGLKGSDDVGRNRLGTLPGLGALQARVTPDGRHLLFSATNGDELTQYDHGICQAFGSVPCIEVYLYSADSDELVCASCNSDGRPATADASIALGTGHSGTGATAHLPHALSEDGSRVFFTSGEPLLGADRNGTARDAYMFDAETGRLHLLSSGRDEDDSYWLEASPDGDDAFFATRERLVGWDRDNGYDLYDARLGGGFPEPAPSEPACIGDACQGDLATGPAARSRGTVSLIAPGNAKPKRQRAKKVRCAKGKRKIRRSGKVRCVKKKTANRSHKRNANSNRRTSR